MGELSKVLVLGGTGKAGICLLRELLYRNHDTIVYARNPSKIPEDVASNRLLTVIKGEITDKKALSSAISRCQIIVSLLGPVTMRMTDPAQYATFYKDSIFPLMREHSVKRIYAMGTISIRRSEDSFSFVRWLIRLFMMTIAMTVYRNVLAIEKVFETEATDLEWLVYRIAGIPGETDEASWRIDREEGKTFVGWVGEKGWQMSQKRAALTRWLVDAVEGGAEEWIGKMPAVSKLA